MQKWLCWVVLLFCFSASFNTEASSITYSASGKAISFHSSTLLNDTVSAADSVRPRKHRVIAAILALPPFGWFAVHRMYLGTADAVPLAYIATYGGAFGVLPFIDLVLIVLTKDVNTYAHDRRLFMWTHKRIRNKKN